MIPVNPENTKAGDQLALRLGHETFAEVQTKDTRTATALIIGTIIVEVGATVSLFLNSSDCHLLDSAEEALPRLKLQETAHLKRAG